MQAAAQLKVKWVENPLLPSNGNFFKMMRDQDAAGKTTNTVAATGQPRRRLRLGGEGRLSATYAYGYNSHAPMGPTCCVADVRSNGAVIYSNGQDSYVARPRVAADPRAAGQLGALPLLRGRRLVRRPSGPLRRPAGGRADLAARGRAGAAAVHALGRARLGRLRPELARRTSGPASTRRARSPRSRRAAGASRAPRSRSCGRRPRSSSA